MDFFYIQTYILVIGVFYGITTSNAKRKKCSADEKRPWTYDPTLPNGPQHWYQIGYPDCNGDRQSPINIVTDEVISDPQTLQVTNYDKPLAQVRIENNGYRITMYPIDGVQRTLEFKGDVYILHSIHFHMGCASHNGSEHEINGQRSKMECHLEHRAGDGSRLTLASLIEQGEINYSLDVMLSVSSEYTYKGDSFQGAVSKSNPTNSRTQIYLDDLVEVGGPLFHYSGSLEYPPCTENKLWLVLKSHKQVAASQMQQFFNLRRIERNSNDTGDCYLVNNYRNINPTNGRPVYG